MIQLNGYLTLAIIGMEMMFIACTFWASQLEKRKTRFFMCFSVLVVSALIVLKLFKDDILISNYYPFWKMIFIFIFISGLLTTFTMLFRILFQYHPIMDKISKYLIKFKSIFVK
jgi:hypothetical protein